MSSKDNNLSKGAEEELASVEEYSFAVVVADWNSDITYKLKDGCIDTLKKYGAKTENIHVAHVPGAYELPMGARLMMGKEKIHAAICIGCVIKGETKHNEYINNAVANGLSQLSILKNKPFIFGVLTPNNYQQALDRAGGKHGNKGVEAAITALRMVALYPFRETNKIGS